MRCSEIHDRLDDHIRDLLSPDVADKVTAHLADCPACAEEYESHKRLLTLLEAEPDLSNDKAELADFLPGVWDKIENGRTKSYKGWLYKLAPSLAAAALLAFIIFKPAIETTPVQIVDAGKQEIYVDSSYYDQSDYLYTDDEIYSESNYQTLIGLLFSDYGAETIESYESELDYESTMFSDYGYSLDDLSDETLELMDERLNELYNHTG
ncbi:MAG: hypothetical protein GY839_12110 [candidate division Zixibacteria bacterium]|nr:hypothetical protein [candidate division Zixibacteria bacterium]